MSAIEIITASAAIIAAVAACASPVVTSVSQVFLFAGMRAIRNYLQPPAVPGAVSTDSKLVCKFEPVEPYQ